MTGMYLYYVVILASFVTDGLVHISSASKFLHSYRHLPAWIIGPQPDDCTSHAVLCVDLLYKAESISNNVTRV